MRRNDYHEQWRRYRKLRTLLVLSFIGHLPVVSVLTLLETKMFGAFAPSCVFAVGSMLMFAVVGTRLATWPCPRRGKWFSGTW
jgi:hypothetical protein